MDDNFNEQREEVLDNFDFEKVAKVMRYLDWTWAGNEEPPSVYQLIKQSTSMLNDAYISVMEMYKKGKKEAYMNIQTCGFSATASYYENQGLCLNLEFVIASWKTEC